MAFGRNRQAFSKLYMERVQSKENNSEIKKKDGRLTVFD